MTSVYDRGKLWHKLLTVTAPLSSKHYRDKKLHMLSHIDIELKFLNAFSYLS